MILAVWLPEKNFLVKILWEIIESNFLGFGWFVVGGGDAGEDKLEKNANQANCFTFWELNLKFKGCFGLFIEKIVM